MKALVKAAPNKPAKKPQAPALAVASVTKENAATVRRQLKAASMRLDDVGANGVGSAAANAAANAFEDAILAIMERDYQEANRLMARGVAALKGQHVVLATPVAPDKDEDEDEEDLDDDKDDDDEEEEEEEEEKPRKALRAR